MVYIFMHQLLLVCPLRGGGGGGAGGYACGVNILTSAPCLSSSFDISSLSVLFFRHQPLVCPLLSTSAPCLSSSFDIRPLSVLFFRHQLLVCPLLSTSAPCLSSSLLPSSFVVCLSSCTRRRQFCCCRKRLCPVVSVCSAALVSTFPYICSVLSTSPAAVHSVLQDRLCNRCTFAGIRDKFRYAFNNFVVVVVAESRRNNNNNTLFTAPHLVRAQNVCKDVKRHAHTHARMHAYHTYTLQIHALLVMDWYNKQTKSPQKTYQYATDKRWVFSFDLEESEDEYLTERGREFQSIVPMK